MQELVQLMKQPTNDKWTDERKEALENLRKIFRDAHPSEDEPYFLSKIVVNEMHVKGHAWCVDVCMWQVQSECWC